MKRAFSRIAGALGVGPKPLSYEEEKLLARHEDVAVRARLAAREDVLPEILYYLAEDPSPEVRRNIAANGNAPRHTDLILARDGDEVVRCDLASKISRLAPGLTANEQEQIQRMTYQVLEILARDQLVRVRRILAETLKDVADAPADIIGKLARDTDIEVAGPVLRSSPVLTDEDLLEIIRTCPIAGPLTAISQRQNIGTRITDAIAQTDDIEAIGALLANPSAQIREETLDHIIDRAPEIEAWHEPLVRRPKLSPRAVTKIAGFVADSLFEVLQSRADLDPDTVRSLKNELQNRIHREAIAPAATKPPEPAAARAKKPAANAVAAVANDKGKAASKAAAPAKPAAGAKAANGATNGNAPAPASRVAATNAPAREEVDPALARARELHAEKQLTEAVVSEALASGDRRFVAAALAVLSNLPVALVEKVAESRSARGVTALCWKAGLGMPLATRLQLRFAHIAPNATVSSVEADKYPLTPDEMNWQIDFFGTMVPSDS